MPLDSTFNGGNDNIHSAQHHSVIHTSHQTQHHLNITKGSHHLFVSGTGLSQSWPGRLQRSENIQGKGRGREGRTDPCIHQSRSTCFQGFTFTVRHRTRPNTSETTGGFSGLQPIWSENGSLLSGAVIHKKG